MKKILLALIMSTAIFGQTVCAEPIIISEQDAVFDNNYQTVTSENKVDKSLSQIEELFNGKDKTGRL